MRLFRKKKTIKEQTVLSNKKTYNDLTPEDFEIIGIVREITGIYHYSDVYFYNHFC